MSDAEARTCSILHVDFFNAVVYALSTVYYKGSVYLATKMPTWLELLCRQSEVWQKQSKNKR